MKRSLVIVGLFAAFTVAACDTSRVRKELSASDAECHLQTVQSSIDGIKALDEKLLSTPVEALNGPALLKFIEGYREIAVQTNVANLKCIGGPEPARTDSR